MFHRADKLGRYFFLFLKGSWLLIGREAAKSAFPERNAVNRDDKAMIPVGKPDHYLEMFPGGMAAVAMASWVESP